MDHKYNLKDMDDIDRYVQLIGFIESPFHIEEISNGNMNYVYRIRECNSGKTYILKYAAEHTRISKDIAVSTDRIKIEANALRKFGAFIPDFIPHIYHYDDMNKCIIMNECVGYTILRDLLNQYNIVDNFSEKITTYLVLGTIPTLISRNKLINEELFTNPLCEVTKEFVFTEPFDPNSRTNAIFEPNMNFIQNEVYNDQKLLKQIDIIKNVFLEKKQALIHGDLHTGSILVNKSSVIVFDYEFAFYGPIGFDIGNLIANLIFSWLHAKVNDDNQNKKFIEWLELTIKEIIDKFRMKLCTELDEISDSVSKESIIDVDSVIYVDSIIQDTASFAGVELLRRIIGIAHVSDIVSIKSEIGRTRAERVAIKLAKEYILFNNTFHKGEDFINTLKKSCEKEL